MNVLTKIMKKFPTREGQNKAIRALTDDDELYQTLIEGRDEYLEWLREKEKLLLQDDKYMSELYAVVCNQIEEAERFMSEPGWQALDLHVSKRNLEVMMSDKPEDLMSEKASDKKRDKEWAPFQDKTMGDLEMAAATGLTRGRIVQATKEFARKFIRKCDSEGLRVELKEHLSKRKSYDDVSSTNPTGKVKTHGLSDNS